MRPIRVGNAFSERKAQMELLLRQLAEELSRMCGTEGSCEASKGLVGAGSLG